MECLNQKRNTARCTCTYSPCSRHGICCECVEYHRGLGELPACLFTAGEERTYDRSVSFFVKSRR